METIKYLFGCLARALSYAAGSGIEDSKYNTWYGILILGLLLGVFIIPYNIVRRKNYSNRTKAIVISLLTLILFIAVFCGLAILIEYLVNL